MQSRDLHDVHTDGTRHYMRAATIKEVNMWSFSCLSHEGIKHEYNIKALIPILDTR
jgi:hypothetical protein